MRSCVWWSRACTLTPNMVRQHNCTVERGLVVIFCGQPPYCNWPHYLTAWFSSHNINHFWCLDRSNPVSCNLHKWGLVKSSTCDCGQLQTANNIVDMCPLTKFKGRLRSLRKAQDGAFKWLESTATTALVIWMKSQIIIYTSVSYTHLTLPTNREV